MTKTDLIKRIRKESGLTETQTRRALDATITVILDAIAQNEEVNITGFGTFRSTTHESREIYKVGNGEKISIPSRKVLRFKASTTIKNKIN